MAVSDLGELLKKMKPKLFEGTYYFASVDSSNLMELANYLDDITGIFRENEGLTIVFSGKIKDDILQITEKDIIGPFALITLSVESDLMAIGFLAKITEALAKEKISVNAFSAYHHDHIFVPFERKDDAMKALMRL